MVYSSVCLRNVLMLVFLYGFKEEVVKASKNELIEVPLTKINSNYYGYIMVGTPKAIKAPSGQQKGEHYQIFRVNFDTGSQHLWLLSRESCPTNDCKNVKYTPFDKNKSASYRARSEQFRLEYTDGTVVDGRLGWDKVKLGFGGASVEFNQTIGFASKVKGILEDCDGIFGLGLISTPLFLGSPDPPMESLRKSFGITEFGIYMSRVLHGDNAGKLVFGGHDEALMQGELQWHDVVKVRGKYEGYKIKFDKLIVEKPGYKRIVKFSNMLALPDSGNNVIIGPANHFDPIKDGIMKHAKGVFDYNPKTYSFECSENVSVLPNLIFVMDGREYTMYPRDYIWTLKRGKRCKLGIFGMDTDHIVLGQIFMQTFYSKFSLTRHAVGFARARHSTG